jgi:hypothetical protein
MIAIFSSIIKTTYTSPEKDPVYGKNTLAVPKEKKNDNRRYTILNVALLQ